VEFVNNEECIEIIEKEENDSIFKVTRFLLFVCILFLFGSMILVLIMPSIAEYIMQYVLIALPVIWFVFKNEKWSFRETFRFNKLKIRDVLILIGITISIQPFLNLMLIISQVLFGDAMGVLFEEAVDEPVLLLVFSMAITPAICEELIMRGVVLHGSRGLSIWKASLLNGVLFGFFHMNFNQFSYTIFMGIILAYVVLITNSIFAGMLIHFLNNFWAISSYIWPENNLLKLEEWVVNHIFTLAGIIIVVLSIIVTFVLLKLLEKSNSDKKYVPDPQKQSNRVLEWPFWLIAGLFAFSSVLIMLSVSLSKMTGI
jgi:membrane protease YdiL (CAAX protease family)